MAYSRAGSIDDFKIIQAVLKGDREAYAEIVRTYQTRILSYCVSMLLDRAEADDAAQDVFLKAFASLHQYKRDVSLQAWLYRIASNHCLDVLRKKKRQKTDSLDHIVERDGELLYAAASETRPGAEPPLEKEERLGAALKVLSSLPADQREILLLREVEGLPYEQISSVLHCSLDAVKARLRRARQRLHEKTRHFLEERSFHK